MSDGSNSPVLLWALAPENFELFHLKISLSNTSRKLQNFSDMLRGTGVLPPVGV
jgi:hypothetical protein